MVVNGRVQGVFFRDSTRQQAREHGVAGWVSNRSDGAVEAVLEGTPGAVERVLSFCAPDRPTPTSRMSMSAKKSLRA